MKKTKYKKNKKTNKKVEDKEQEELITETRDEEMEFDSKLYTS